MPQDAAYEENMEMGEKFVLKIFALAKIFNAGFDGRYLGTALGIKIRVLAEFSNKIRSRRPTALTAYNEFSLKVRSTSPGEPL